MNNKALTNLLHDRGNLADEAGEGALQTDGVLGGDGGVALYLD